MAPTNALVHVPVAVLGAAPFLVLAIAASSSEMQWTRSTLPIQTLTGHNMTETETVS